MPAAAVIPALLVYDKVVAVKTFLVGLWPARHGPGALRLSAGLRSLVDSVSVRRLIDVAHFLVSAALQAARSLQHSRPAH